MHGDHSANPVHKRFVPKDQLVEAALAALREGMSARLKSSLKSTKDGDEVPLHWRAFCATAGSQSR